MGRILAPTALRISERNGKVPKAFLRFQSGGTPFHAVRVVRGLVTHSPIAIIRKNAAKNGM
jgi:hypothetical protein